MRVNPMQCTAKNRRGEQCKKHAAHGKTKCDRHGAKSPRGVESPHFKHGKFSKDIPTSLLARYEASLADPNLLYLTDLMALMDSRIGHLLQRMGSGEAVLLEVAGLVKELRAHVEGTALGIVERLEAALSAPVEDPDLLWEALETTTEQRRKLTESATKYQQQTENMISLDQFLLLMGAVTSSIKNHVPDPKVRAAIGTELERLMNRSGANDE